MVIRGKWNGNEYKLIELIGTGNFGKVYKAVDYKGITIAIKISKDILSITNEYNAMVKLNSMFFAPKVYDFDDWEYGGEIQHFIVMDYIKGKNLKEISDYDKFNIRTIFKIGKVLINILSKIDILGYKYTDIKLENILVDKNGYIYFVDFGSLVERDKPTKEYTPNYNINSWNVKFDYNYKMGLIFSITMVMVAMIGKKEYNPLVYSLEKVKDNIYDFQLKRAEKQFLINSLQGKFKTFDKYNRHLSLLIKDKEGYTGLSKIDYLLIISIVSFIFVIIIGIKSIF